MGGAPWFGASNIYAAPLVAQALEADTTLAPIAPEPRIGNLSVSGNAAVDSARILRSFGVTNGDLYVEDALRRGMRRLFGLGLFDDIWLERNPRGPVVDVVVHVRERPRIARVTFSGNKKRETSELERKLILRPGTVFSPITVQSQIDSLRKYYVDEGFAQATFEARLDTLSEGRQLAIEFVIDEGLKVSIRNVRFEGATAFPSKRLRKQLKTKTKGFFGGGDVREENFEEDRRKLEAYYRNHGYRDMRVLGHTLEAGKEPRHLTLVVAVEEGPSYRFGEVSWSGNQVVDEQALKRLWRGKQEEDYDASKIQQAVGQTYGEYADHGYLYVNVEPRETVRDDVVDVQFVVTEGGPSSIRMVTIHGNRGTREKVIRREIDIHEGDRFRRSALVRSQGDIMRLSLFEDVQVDFQPADSTDVDLSFTVKEKQVGTASAGAGFAGESGLTGFLELGHNNVLGNGQTLALHLERGSRREDYFLSFTEPWFRDTPTLLGFSLFSTQRERDLFKEDRLGGSGQIGRPLPWPDFARGSFSYRLEKVTIEQLGDTLTVQDSLVLAGVPIGDGVVTSSLTTNFLRNSTDNPFYPTRGTRLGLTTELAGGAFGGQINFHKHRLDGRVYVPSLLKGVTTMGRVRLGVLGRYAGQDRSVPPYERFRLGGGTTVDPLRGYDDYQVVPSKYIRDVPLVTTDTLGAVADTIGFQRIRYPGGRFMIAYTFEQQFPIMHPLHGVLFLDAGNTWDLWEDIRPFDLKIGAGIGFRLEIPLLGNIGFDYGYGFDRDDGARGKGHFLLGNFDR